MHPEHRQGGKAMAGLTLTKVPAQGKGRHRDRPRTLQVPAELKILVGTSSCCGRRRARSERVREQYVHHSIAFIRNPNFSLSPTKLSVHPICHPVFIFHTLFGGKSCLLVRRSCIVILPVTKC